MKITTVGIDLAKNVFQVYGIDERGKAVLRKQLRRAQVAAFFGNLPPMPKRSARWWGGRTGATGQTRTLEQTKSRQQSGRAFLTVARPCHRPVRPPPVSPCYPAMREK
jgi:transposase